MANLSIKSVPEPAGKALFAPGLIDHELAIEMRAPLVTFDRKLGDRAREVLAG